MKKIKSIMILSIMTALTLTACSNTYSDTDDFDADILYSKIGALSSNTVFGLPSCINNGFIYYWGTDGYYEYDPEDKTSAKVFDPSETSSKEEGRRVCPEFNVVDNGFVAGENGKAYYLNYRGEVLSEFDFHECEFNEWVFAYEDRIFHTDYVFDTKSKKSTRLFEERDVQYGFYYGLSSDCYFRVSLDDKSYEKISLKDKNAEAQTVKLPEEIERISGFAVDLNSDIYISSSDEKGSKKLYKIAADNGEAEVVDIAADTIHFAVLNGNVAYMDYYVNGDNDNLYYNNILVSDNAFRFTLLNEKYLIYTVQIITGTDEFGQLIYTEDVYLYDIEQGSTEQLKTVT